MAITKKSIQSFTVRSSWIMLCLANLQFPSVVFIQQLPFNFVFFLFFRFNFRAGDYSVPSYTVTKGSIANVIRVGSGKKFITRVTVNPYLTKERIESLN